MTTKTATEGIYLPGWFCAKCHIFTGTAKEEHLTCRCCGAPRSEPEPSDFHDCKAPMRELAREVREIAGHMGSPYVNKEDSPARKTLLQAAARIGEYTAMLDNLTVTQSRCTELKLENQKLRTALHDICLVAAQGAEEDGLLAVLAIVRIAQKARE